MKMFAIDNYGLACLSEQDVETINGGTILNPFLLLYACAEAALKDLREAWQNRENGCTLNHEEEVCVDVEIGI